LACPPRNIKKIITYTQTYIPPKCRGYTPTYIHINIKNLNKETTKTPFSNQKYRHLTYISQHAKQAHLYIPSLPQQTNFTHPLITQQLNNVTKPFIPNKPTTTTIKLTNSTLQLITNTSPNQKNDSKSPEKKNNN